MNSDKRHSKIFFQPVKSTDPQPQPTSPNDPWDLWDKEWLKPPRIPKLKIKL